jgi:hypothetical protein
MLSLIGRIDASKSLLQSQFRQSPGFILFPGRSIQKNRLMPLK